MPGFTLIEVVASLTILAILLVGVLVAYRRTIDSVALQILRERAVAVGQRHLELLLASTQEPNSINLPTRDEIDPLFTWQLDLKRITVGSKPPKNDYSNTIIQAAVTVKCDTDGIRPMPLVELVRYFSNLKPIPGHAVAVPITHKYEDPAWYLELKGELGREPTFEETIKRLIDIEDLPPELAEELKLLEEAEEFNFDEE